MRKCFACSKAELRSPRNLNDEALKSEGMTGLGLAISNSKLALITTAHRQSLGVPWPRHWYSRKDWASDTFPPWPLLVTLSSSDEGIVSAVMEHAIWDFWQNHHMESVLCSHVSQACQCLVFIPPKPQWPLWHCHSILISLQHLLSPVDSKGSPSMTDWFALELDTALLSDVVSFSSLCAFTVHLSLVCCLDF